MDGNSLLLQHAPYLGIFVLLILGTLGFPFPEDGVLLLSGFLIAQSIMKPFPGLLIVYSGLITTDFLLYSVGKRYGRKLIEQKKFKHFILPVSFSRLEEKFEKWGIWLLLIGRLFWGLRTQILMAAGAMRMSRLKFLLVDGTSVFLTMTLWIGVGCWGGGHVKVLKEEIIKIENIILLALAIMAPMAMFLRYYMRRKNRMVGHDC
jgi:membrane protein DedA with SNARE-associated domain